MVLKSSEEGLYSSGKASRNAIPHRLFASGSAFSFCIPDDCGTASKVEMDKLDRSKHRCLEIFLRIGIVELTSWDLPSSAFGDSEGVIGNGNIDFARFDKEYHVHLSRILLSLVAVRRYLNNAGTKEGKIENLSILKG